MFEIKYIEDEPALSKVLHLCYSVLGESTAQNELYSYDAWKKRMGESSRLLVYAQENDRVISLVLGRPENNDSLVCGDEMSLAGRRSGLPSAYPRFFFSIIRLISRALFQSSTYVTNKTARNVINRNTIQHRMPRRDVKK